MRDLIFLTVLCALTIISHPIHAADPPDPRRAVTDPGDADSDFALQGEYTGKLGDDQVKHGVQVIALGGGNFRAVAYPGGLPGDGWNGEGKIEIESKRVGDQVEFRSDGGSGVLNATGLTVYNADNVRIGELARVQRTSPTLGAKPPEGAVVLFDGKSTDGFKNARTTADGLLMEGTTSVPVFQSGKLHLEFLLSYMPYARGQGRSNSGCYLQSRYEVQILDSFGLSGEHNECGGIYSVAKPAINMCFPPLAWQTYDIDFTAARFDESGKKTANARMTVRHNGVVIHDDIEVDHKTTAAPLGEGPEPGPLYLQNHSNPVRFRNIWFVPTQN